MGDFELDFSAQHKKYNDIPVHYCKQCLSLRILDLNGIEYCDKCSSTDIEECNIEEWEELYKQKFNSKYINK